MKNKIFYFTGTGNSMRAAQKIAEVLKNTEIISMKENPEMVNAEECEVIGFIFPVYHWSMPDAAIKFVEKLKINSKAYIFCVAMPSFVCGESCEKLEEILKKKNAKISYGNKVYCVANYAIVYPPLPPKKLIVPRTEKKLNKIAHDILNRTVRPIPKANFIVRKKIKSVMDKYKKVYKYGDMGFKVNEDCISCGLCSKVCPVKNIELVGGKPTFKHNCSQCMACVSFCPKRAIGYKLNEEDLEKCGIDTKTIKVIKIMKLPKKRKCYHNPYITSSDMIKNNIIYEDKKL